MLEAPTWSNSDIVRTLSNSLLSFGVKISTFSLLLFSVDVPPYPWVHCNVGQFYESRSDCVPLKLNICQMLFNAANCLAVFISVL